MLFSPWKAWYLCGCWGMLGAACRGHPQVLLLSLTLTFSHAIDKLIRDTLRVSNMTQPPRLGLCLLCRHNFGNNVHIHTWGIARNNVYTCGKTWVGRTHKSIHTMRNVMVYCCRAPELQYSRNEVHVMMAPPVTVTRAQYVASTEDIAPSYDCIDV